jgi:hypothetical protein
MAPVTSTQRTSLAVAAFAALALGAGAVTATAAIDTSAPPTGSAGATTLSAALRRGGWDGNSNEPMLADAFA